MPGPTLLSGSSLVDLNRGTIQFIGTATVLLKYAGFTILTDPNFLHAGDHVHLGYGLTSKRLTQPALELDELPPIDFVVLSHLHEDHFDREVARRLAKNTPIVTTPKAARALTKMGFKRTYSLNRWRSRTFRRGDAQVRLTAMPGRHAPGLLSLFLPPVMGTMLDFMEATGRPLVRLYVSGDTLIHRAIRDIPKRFPDIDLALLHLGGTRVLGLLVTMDGRQGVEMVKIIGAKQNVPIHYDDYTVFKSPISDFIAEVKAAGLEDRVEYLMRGETLSFEIPLARRRGLPGVPLTVHTPGTTLGAPPP